jgi:hypothetical protein
VANCAAVAISEKPRAPAAWKFNFTDGGSDGGILFDYGHWERLAAAMLGFIIIRKILTYRLGPQKAVEMIN